jgi:hypothetical protein
VLIGDVEAFANTAERCNPRMTEMNNETNENLTDDTQAETVEPHDDAETGTEKEHDAEPEAESESTAETEAETADDADDAEAQADAE